MRATGAAYLRRAPAQSNLCRVTFKQHSDRASCAKQLAHLREQTRAIALAHEYSHERLGYNFTLHALHIVHESEDRMSVLVGLLKGVRPYAKMRGWISWVDRVTQAQAPCCVPRQRRQGRQAWRESSRAGGGVSARALCRLRGRRGLAGDVLRTLGGTWRGLSGLI